MISDHVRNSTPVTVVIGSAGRRVYLIRWFREALERCGTAGRILTTDNDRTSASFGYADRSVWMPRYEEPAYGAHMLRLFAEVQPDLFITANDYEADALSRGLAESLSAYCPRILIPTRATQEIVSDKYAMYAELTKAGIPVPETWLASATSLGQSTRTESPTGYVVKHRFGSGSSGLQFAASPDLPKAIEQSARRLPASATAGRSHMAVMDHIIVQHRLIGSEYGVDGVFDVDADRLAPRAVLARRKLSMRAGETDKAVTVNPDKFRPIISRLGETLHLKGIIDTDIIERGDGSLFLIDINPRFGGGYPFVHAAGADVPQYFIQSILGDPDPRVLSYDFERVSAKFDDVRSVYG